MGKTKHEDYEAFVEKFKPKPKLTTDDCYTPPPVYEAVLGWVKENIHIPEGARIMRPFKPGGDFEKEDYTGAVVIDNPPFSIFKKIVRWYTERDIKFFLFAPHLTLFGCLDIQGITAIVCKATVTYENGANVSTSFVTNMDDEDIAFRISPELAGRIEKANKDRAIAKVKGYKWPDNVVNSGLLGKIIRQGVSLTVKRNECIWVEKLDCGQKIYGMGVLLSDAAAARYAKAKAAAKAAKAAAAAKAAVEAAAAEEEKENKKIKVELSEREKELVRKLSENDEHNQ